MQDVLLYLLSMQSGPGNAVASSFKGQSPSGGWKRVILGSTQLGKPRGPPLPGIVPGRHQKILGDSSAFEGAGEVHKI